MRDLKVLIAGLLMFSVIQANATEVSVWGGRIDADRSSDIPYVYDEDTSSIHGEEIGDDTSYGLSISQSFNDWIVNFSYRKNSLDNDGVFDTDPAEPNDCNARMIQGIYDDCIDTVTVDIETDLNVFDFTIGQALTMNGVSVLPYAGIRYMRYEQDIDYAHIYPGGNESSGTNNFDYKGFGLLGGVKLEIPIGNGVKLKSDLSVGKMLTGDRDQKISEVVTSGGSFDSSNTQKTSDDVDSLMIDANIMLAYQLGNGVEIGAGWRYHRINDVVNTQNSNNAVFPANTIGSSEKNLTMDGFYGELSFEF
ncbi:MAG: Lpg1974 family pore-forming outer membrane protein [Cycloclasticus sp.]|nr:Lpg1974 family pore-forming outer membrane protein [Cycloclasticus sp.]